MEKPIRILHILGNVAGGGVETIILNYYKNIDHNRIQFDFVIHDNTDQNGHFTQLAESLGAIVYKVPPYSRLFSYMYQIYNIIKKNQYVIVHSNLNTLSFFSLFAAKLGGAHYRILHNHSTANKREGFRAIFKYILRPFSIMVANQYCACSKHAAMWMYGSLNNVFIVKNAIELSRFQYNINKRNVLRTSLGISHKIVIGHVGRFMYQKNHVFLLKIFSEILKLNPNSILVLIGDGALKKTIEHEATKIGIIDKVKFLGLRGDVNELYSAMDAFVFPSWFEGLGMVAIEAQASGLPVLCSNYVPTEVKIDDHVEFMSLAVGAKEWAQKILHMISCTQRENHINQLADAGYDIKQEVESLMCWYEALIKYKK